MSVNFLFRSLLSHQFVIKRTSDWSHIKCGVSLHLYEDLWLNCVLLGHVTYCDQCCYSQYDYHDIIMFISMRYVSTTNCGYINLDSQCDIRDIHITQLFIHTGNGISLPYTWSFCCLISKFWFDFNCLLMEWLIIAFIKCCTLG